MDRAFVQSWLHQFDIYNYVILDDLSVNIKGDVYLHNTHIEEFKVQFNEVSGSFICSYNRLKSLKGSPRIVEKTFDCSNNQITSLIEGPKQVGRHYDFSYNQVSSLEGLPTFISHDLVAHENPIHNFSHISQYVGKHLYIDYQTLEKLTALAHLDASDESRIYFHTDESLGEGFIHYKQKKYFMHFSTFKKKMLPFIEKAYLDSIIINDDTIEGKKNRKL